jgi:hypothetical protein
MTYCGAKDGSFSCTLDPNHYGPNHVDNNHGNHGWFDFDLPESPAPEELLNIPILEDGEL